MAAPDAAPVVVPYVHLNGTGRAQLMDERITTAGKIREAMDALTAMAPNGRDYYLDRTGERWRAAVAQADRRMAALRALYDELVAEYEAIDGAGR